VSRIRVTNEAGVGRITLARPEKKNALDQQTVVEMTAAVRRLDSDAATRVIAVAADGPDFCAGADLEALEATLDAGSEVHLRDALALGELFLALRSSEVPVVAILPGRALAGGAGLATGCDLVLAHENSEFGYPEVRVGFVPAMVMTMLRRIVGEKQAFELVATGRTISAREALGLGLVSRVLPDSDFERDAEEVVATLAAAAPKALRATKRLFYELAEISFRDGIMLAAQVNAQARTTTEFRDGVRRFLLRSQHHA